MAPRKYQQTKRQKSTEETRERIIKAVAELHAEKGIVATTIPDIAIRADVGIGTVYHHFPNNNDDIRACGKYMYTITRPPTPEIFDGIQSVEQRVTRLVKELFSYYERYPSFERARCDQDKLPVLAKAVAQRDQALEAVVSEALSPVKNHGELTQMIVAFTDFAVYRSLTRKGISTQEASDQVTEVLLIWIKSILPSTK